MGADIVFISVNTPTKTAGIGAGRAANVKNCELCARTIAEVSTSDKIVVEKSTVPVRTSDAVRAVLEHGAKPGVKFSSLEQPRVPGRGYGRARLGDSFQSVTRRHADAGRPQSL